MRSTAAGTSGNSWGRPALVLSAGMVHCPSSEIQLAPAQAGDLAATLTSQEQQLHDACRKASPSSSAANQILGLARPLVRTWSRLFCLRRRLDVPSQGEIARGDPAQRPSSSSPCIAARGMVGGAGVNPGRLSRPKRPVTCLAGDVLDGPLLPGRVNSRLRRRSVSIHRGVVGLGVDLDVLAGDSARTARPCPLRAPLRALLPYPCPPPPYPRQPWPSGGPQRALGEG